jgi:hypothetical protein
MVLPVYPSDLNDAEWALLAPLIPSSNPMAVRGPRICAGSPMGPSPSCVAAVRGCLGAICPARVRRLADRL